MRVRLSDQRGQTASEYLGLLVLIAVLVAAFVQLGIGEKIGSAIEAEICKIAGLGCPAPVHASTDPVAPSGGTGPGSPAAVPVSASAGAPAPTPAPSEGWRWPVSAGKNADQLPTDGERPYSPPKSGRGNPVPGKRSGSYVDEDGNIWEWAPPGQQHGGPHWDVQHPKSGKHTNVDPDGKITHGDDNFPNRRRQPKPPPPPPPPRDDPNPGGDTAKHVAEGAGVIATAGTILWWVGKAASPACGPFAPVCAVVL